MRSYKTLVIVFVVVCMCGKGMQNGGVALNIHYIQPQKSPALYILSLPQGADKVVVTITGTDFSPIVKGISVAANPSGVTISGIPAGDNRSIGIDIKDATGAVIARGKTARVSIKAGSVNNVDILVTQTGLFTQLVSKVIPRAFAVSNPLPDGTYMMMGGVIDQQSSCGRGCIQLNATSQTEIYEPATGVFRRGPSMMEQRALFTANVLSDGSIVVAGGTDIINVSCNMTACSIIVPQNHTKSSIEVYDPRSNSFYKAGTMTVSRVGHTANTLSNDAILFAGGISTNGPSDSAELIDIRASRNTVYTMSFARVFQSAAVYSDDEAFLAGGNSECSNTEFFRLTGFTISNNITCSTSFLSSIFISAAGEVLLNGGINAYSQPVAQMMLIDPFKKVVHSYNSMRLPRALFSDVALGDGNILIAGGVTTSAFTTTASAEIFSPVSKSFVKYPLLSVQRAAYAAQYLQDGSALIVGGFSSTDLLSGNIAFLDTAEIYNP